MMLREFRADLHIHTCLSPCGDLSMVPGVIVREALRKQLDVIGICDHNAAENVPAVRKAAERENLAVMAGMEITSQEEVHLLTFFDNERVLLELQKEIYENLPGSNNERVFGEQVVVNENDEVVGLNQHLLMGATGLPLERIVETVHSLSGLAIASHVDRESFGILGQLGFIPQGLPLDAVELSVRVSPAQAQSLFPQVSTFPVVTFSDAHYPEDIGRRWTGFVLNEPRVEEVRNALLERQGRRVFFAG